jgi:hypothetical protein
MGAVDLIPFNGVQQATSAPTLYALGLTIYLYGMDSSIKISGGTLFGESNEQFYARTLAS